MLHLRVISPDALTDPTLDLLRDDEAVTHLFVLRGAAQRPAGDVISCDIAREGAQDILDRLRGLGLEKEGGISVEQVDLTLSTAADSAVDRTPGEPSDAIVWSDIEQRSGDEAKLSWTYLVLMTVAMIIASIGAYWVPWEAGGSVVQLLINLAAIIVAGVLTLIIQRYAQRQLARRRSRS
ncbi:hypothetical protein [Microlunatus parietis]|uniref:Uncharacterized protein n=1 Tax=Microlunatus parietis TaxID=682979 RepID=A0A7Y9LCE6_9ACTN|nr:hypothetical protein [Microlunatus parietis]NYE71758.1 hypothetical protein [Microlunatus parietis]